MKLFKTIKEAAVDALRAIAPKSKSEQVEYGGLIVKHGKDFYATKPVTDNDCCGVDLPPERWGLPLSDTVSAYHVHPVSKNADSTTRFFSDSDMHAGTSSGYSEWYMAAPMFGEIYKATPNSGPVAVHGTDGDILGIGSCGETVAKL